VRIAYLLADPGIPVGGTKGASAHVAEVCRALVARGASVLLLAQRVEGPAPPGVRLVHLDPGPVPKGAQGELARVAAAEGFIRRAEPVLEVFRPDAVIERLSLFSGGCRQLTARLGATRLVEVNAPVSAERARHFGLQHRDLACTLEHQALDRCHAVVVSDALVGWARSRGAAKVTVVANGVDPVRYRPLEAERETVRASLDLDDRELIGFVGSLKPWHGVPVLFDAVERLAPERPRLSLLVVGDGPARESLEQRARSGALAGRIVLTGGVANADVPRYLSALDVAAAPFLPSDDFYFSPLKVVEAMAAGLPVVASRLAPIEAMLGGTGELVAAGDAAALAGGIRRLLDDPARAQTLGDAARRRAQTQLSWDRVAERILVLLQPTRSRFATLKAAV
jgi:glycosyltransferase involved in cell wall biosynthesis